MGEDDESHLQGERVFRVRLRTLIIMPTIILAFGAVPFANIYELVTTGTIELFEPLGRRKIAPWIIYLSSWICWLWFLQVFARMLRYYRNPVMFILHPDAFEKDGIITDFDAVHLVESRLFLGNAVVKTENGPFTIHPQLAAGAVSALQHTFGDNYIAKGFKDGPSWFVGK